MRTLFLDTETTGLSGQKDRIVEIAIIGEDGEVVMDTLVNPGIPIPYQAERIHGISDGMVRGAPSFETLWPRIESSLRGHRVIIYNAKFDQKFFPDQLACAAEVQCAMLAYAARRGERSEGRRGFRWHKLSVAAEHVGHDWSGAAHRARGDAEACRSVWLWLQDGTKPQRIHRPKQAPALTPPRPTPSVVTTPVASHPISIPRPSAPVPPLVARASTPTYEPATPPKPSERSIPWFWIVVGVFVLLRLCADLFR